MKTAFGSPGELEEDVQGISSGSSPNARSSLYVDLFEEMLDTVLHHEGFLLSPTEVLFFQKYRDLSFHARYLLIRLTLRKSGTWFRCCKLETQYSGELGPNTLSAMNELIECRFTSLEDETCESESQIIRFASGDVDATLCDLLDCLHRDELKVLAQRNNVGRPNMNMKDLRGALLTHSDSQTVLPFLPIKKSGTTLLNVDEATIPSQTTYQIPTKTVKSEKLRQQVLSMTSKCIRIDDFARVLFSRVNLIYLRSASIDQAEALLLPCILNRTRRRTYPSYSYCRSSTIFATRNDLVAYEEALRIEAAVDAAFAGKSASDKTGRERIIESRRSSRARMVREIWEKAWDEWVILVSRYRNCIDTNGFERFESGYVLTRVIYKGAEALAQLGEYELESEVLKALLAQKRWRRSKRGAWWERLALVYTNHMHGDEEQHRKRALQIVIEGLEDPLTHTKYRPTLERRMKRLESLLKLGRSERRKCQYKQKKHSIRRIEGERIWLEPEDLEKKPSPNRPVLKDSMNLPKTLSQEESKSPASTMETPKEGRSSQVILAWRKGKSVWKGKDGEEVTVEDLSLQHYERLGFRGVHSEGCIIAFLFSLLFWDILFAPVPGAFETPYQTAPLDLWEDTFYFSRKDMIKNRISELEDGKGPGILKEVDDRERPKNTWCIGVKWERFGQADLLEIVKCMGSKLLAGLCAVLAEDYSLGTAGVPDLFVWDPAEKRSMFVEVKGPGDTLQENQKVWIDILIRVGFVVELCKVVEEGNQPLSLTADVMEGEGEEGEGRKTEKGKKRKKKKRGADLSASKMEIICLLSEEEEPTKAALSTRASLPLSPIKEQAGRPSRPTTSNAIRFGETEVFVHQLSPPRKRKRTSI